MWELVIEAEILVNLLKATRLDIYLHADGDNVESISAFESKRKMFWDYWWVQL